MHRAIIDTDILSEYLKAVDQNVLAKAESYAQEYGKFTVTSITVFEIVNGLEEKSASAQLARFLAWLEKNEEIVPVKEDFKTAARTKANAKRQGNTVELPD